MTDELGELSETILAALDQAGLGMAVTTGQGESVEYVHVSEAARRLGVGARGEAFGTADRTRLAALREQRARGEDDGGVVRIDIEMRDGRRIPIEVSMAGASYRGNPPS